MGTIKHERRIIGLMAVLYITNIGFPSNCGGGNHIYYIAKGLQKLGERVILITKNPHFYKNRHNIYNGLEVINVDWPKPIFNIGPGKNSAFVTYFLTIPSVFVGIYEIYKIIRMYKIDVIYERFSIPGGLGTLASFLFRIPLVIEINDPHEFDKEKTIYRFMKRMNRKFQLIQAKRIIVVSENLKNIISRETNKSIDVIPCGADIRIFRPSEKNENILIRYGLKDRIIVLYVGSFRSNHGLKDLIEAFYKAKESIDDLTLFIIGGIGDDRCEAIKEVKKMIRTGKDIIWVGEINNKLLPEYISIADVCVAPYNLKGDSLRSGVYSKYGFWGIPIKILEYLSMGKPVISPRIKEIEETFKDSCLYYKEGDADNLARVLIDALEMSEESRIGCGLRGRRIVENNYSWDAIALKTYQLLLEVINNEN